MITPISNRLSLSGEAAERIRDEILSGGFLPGQRLQEARLAARLNISRGPVREAFKVLCAEGLLKEEPNRGVSVAELSAQDVREIFEVRIAIEGRAVQLLARGQTPESIRQLGEHIKTMASAEKGGDVNSVAREDLAFHEAICTLTGFGRFRQVFRRYVPTLHSLVRIDDEALYQTQTPSSIAKEHNGILQAVQDADEQLALSRLESHLEETRVRILAYMESTGSIAS